MRDPFVGHFVLVAVADDCFSIRFAHRKHRKCRDVLYLKQDMKSLAVGIDTCIAGSTRYFDVGTCVSQTCIYM